MKYGYTIADAADRKVFEEAIPFIIEKLHFKPSHDYPEDVDGSIKKEFTRDDGNLILASLLLMPLLLPSGGMAVGVLFGVD